jgi:asparagine synthase (glutamine-hydrolysing)
MCGIAGMFGRGWQPRQLDAMVAAQAHRGPDASGTCVASTRVAGLGHNRLSIIDLSDAGRQPMSDSAGRHWIVFNGEIYNYLELRSELESKYTFRTRTDTEVLLAAYLQWGEACLDRVIGMFAFLIWDDEGQRLFGVRDRFGVKPLHLHETADGALWVASEIKALHAAGAAREPDATAWAGYLSSGTYDHDVRTFWKGIRRVPPGGCFSWTPQQGLKERVWYDPAEVVLRHDAESRGESEVGEELLRVLDESVKLRFRADVPVGVCLSGGLDSSLLLGLVHRLQGRESAVKTFTFYCEDPAYDETPWVKLMLRKSKHFACFCRLGPEEIPSLAAQVQQFQDEPFGGVPTLGMAKVHERACDEGVIVLLDGNGLDEGWAGYDYYQRAHSVDANAGPVQGAQDRSTRPECLTPEFAARAEKFRAPRPFGDPLRDLQYRDIRFSKIPRAMRFADRVSMMHSRELREPFLDHRLIELGLRQPADRKIRGATGKWVPRMIARQILPDEICEAPKRPVHTPQREWLRGPLRDWADACINTALARQGGTWLDSNAVRRAWSDYREGVGDNSFFVWQLISLGLISPTLDACTGMSSERARSYAVVAKTIEPVDRRIGRGQGYNSIAKSN